MFTARGPISAPSGSGPSETTRAGPSRVVTSALRKAGMIDSDVHMSGAGPGKKDKTIRGPLTRRPGRAHIESFKDHASGPARINLLSGRIGPAAAAAAARGAAAGTAKPALRGSRRLAPLDRVPIIGDGDVAPGKSRVVEQWREFVKSRWNPEARILDLQNMAEDPVLKKHKLPLPGQREAAVIYKLASQLEPSIVSLSLANNNLLNGDLLRPIPRYLPKLENLSLQNNQIRQYGYLSYISAKRARLTKLRELILIGNPVREASIAEPDGGEDRYRSEILRQFPTISMLDNQPVVKIEFAVEDKGASPASGAPAASFPSSFPAHMCPGVMVEGLGPIVADFLTKYFTCFDSSRQELIHAYAPSSTFSLSVNTSIPPRARLSGFQQTMPNQKSLEWTPWLAAGSRNLSRMGKLDKAFESLHTSGSDIVVTLAKLPLTKHDISEQEKFVVDAWTINQQVQGQVNSGVVLFINVHGQFTEAPSMGIRSFDRSFILAPSPEGSPMHATWPVTILSDQLVIRAYSSHEVWTPGPMKTQQEAAAMARANPPKARPPRGQIPSNPVLDAIPEPQRSLVVRLSGRTRLNTAFAVNCLEGNGWDFDRAVANFEALKHTIPAEAFQ